MPRSASSLVSFRLTVDLGIPSNAAAFVRLRLSTTLPNTSRASMSKGRFCSTVFQICNRVLNPCTCFAHFHGGTFRPSRHQPDQGGSYDSRSPGEQARKRTLERRVSRTRARPGFARGLRLRGVLREGTRARLQEDLAFHGPRRASAEVRQLLHPRTEIPQHLGD